MTFERFEVLESLDLRDLSQSVVVLNADEPIADLTADVVVLVGSPSVESVASIKSSHPNTKFGLIVKLKSVISGQSRAVSSGEFSTKAKELLGSRKDIEFLGSELHLAAAFATVESALCATQTALAGEAFSLGMKTGVEPHLLYKALAGGAGASWSFRELVPQLLEGALQCSASQQSLAEAKLALSRALSLALSESFYAPLTAMAAQVYAALPSDSRTDLSSIVVGEKFSSPSINTGSLSQTQSTEPVAPAKVGFVGLGAMGSRMSKVLHRGGLSVAGFDVWRPALERFASEGGLAAANLLDCATESEVLLLMVINASQVEEILFDLGKLPRHSVVLIMSTISPSQAQTIGERAAKIRPDVSLVDCPVSGGTPRAASGDLMILAGGLDQAGPGSGKAYHVLKLLSGSAGNNENLLIVPGGIGKGSAVKLVNQHLAGCHISSVMEALAFSSKLGLPGRKSHALLMRGPAWSWMLGHRGGNMLDGLIQPPTSTVNIFVKDMGIVVAEAAALGVSVPLAGHVQQQFILGRSYGWGMDDDSSLIRIWRAAGIDATCGGDEVPDGEDS
ncbi:hypothetical protein JCM24511_08829 [Saitozyma sp. JCM 24511]|nr:hypothetical protein JCM24511_08829 [Saitozyma sp. JCM 24511]